MLTYIIISYKYIKTMKKNSMVLTGCYPDPESAERARMKLGAIAGEFFLIYISGIGWGLKDKRFRLHFENTVENSKLKDVTH